MPYKSRQDRENWEPSSQMEENEKHEQKTQSKN